MYVYPANLAGGPQGEDEWRACPGAGSGTTYVIANVADGVAVPQPELASIGSPGPGAWSVDEASVHSGPATISPDPNYQRAIADCARRGARILGYVNTQHGTAPLKSARSADPATVFGQVRLWFEWYPGIQGVFLDQVSTAGTHAERQYYQTIARHVPGTVVANAGQLPSTDWLLDSGADVIVYENDVDSFRRASFPSWTARYPRCHLAAILHDAGSTDEVVDTCAEARAKGFGLVYITDGRQDSGNPYDGLPSRRLWAALQASC
jgi:hypothetical protein